MLFHVLPQDIFLAPVTPVHPGHPFSSCSRPVTDLELLRRLGLTHGDFMPHQMKAHKSDGCCLKGKSSKSEQKTEDCCKKADSTKTMKADEQTTHESVALDFRGFSPEQIKVKATEKAVVIQAEQKNDYTNVKVSRSVPLPEGVDRKGISCRFVDGQVILIIPRVELKQSLKEEQHTKAEEKSDKKSDEKSCTDCPKEGKDVDMDSERQAELEKSLKNLAELFTAIFGLNLDVEEEKDKSEKKKSKKEDDKKAACEKDQKMEKDVKKCSPEKGNDEMKTEKDVEMKDAEKTDETGKMEKEAEEKVEMKEESLGKDKSEPKTEEKCHEEKVCESEDLNENEMKEDVETKENVTENVLEKENKMKQISEDGEKEKCEQHVEDDMKEDSSEIETATAVVDEVKEEEKDETTTEDGEDNCDKEEEREEVAAEETTESCDSGQHKDEDETCVMTCDEEVSHEEDQEEDDFVKVEKPEEDDSIPVELASVVTEHDTESVTSQVESDHNGNDLEVEKAPLTDNCGNEAPQSAEPKMFKVKLDMSKYEPQNIHVICKDRDVIVEAEREIEEDGYVEVETLRRRIHLPDNVDEYKIESFLNLEGVMTVQAPFEISEDQTSTNEISTETKCDTS